MRKRAIANVASIWIVFILVVFSAHEAFGLWAAVAGGLSWSLAWAIYVNWINKKHRIAVEEYIKDYSIVEKPLYEYHGMTDFYFSRKLCRGQIKLDDQGIHLSLNSAYRIAWDCIKGVTLIEGSDSILARLFLRRDPNSKVLTRWKYTSARRHS
ncbi:hypothetical protein [Halioxenophilus aromaticivorans]|uniref:Uncharacterized protein n=1 Tax=Halioxenophilus aromaticivorans TaxID=1306992 RepID=A0AAV3U8B2_9ALTE